MTNFIRLSLTVVWLTACRTEYTRCEAWFADDPNGLSYDAKLSDPLGDKDPKNAKCTAALGLCNGVESRAMQGVPHPVHEAVCKDQPKPYECTPAWLAQFKLACESQKVGGMVPF